MKWIHKFLIRLVQRPPAKWVLRPPKQHELIWDGIAKKVVGMPFDSEHDHWVLVPQKYGGGMTPVRTPKI